MRTHIAVSSPVERTPRVQQIEGMFDLKPAERSSIEWNVDLPIEDRPWNIGLIVGPSGSGKSTVARRLFGEVLARQEQIPAWPDNRALLDAFPAGMPVKEIVTLLS